MRAYFLASVSHSRLRFVSPVLFLGLRRAPRFPLVVAALQQKLLDLFGLLQVTFDLGCAGDNFALNVVLSVQHQRLEHVLDQLNGHLDFFWVLENGERLALSGSLGNIYGLGRNSRCKCNLTLRDLRIKGAGDAGKLTRGQSCLGLERILRLDRQTRARFLLG